VKHGSIYRPIDRTGLRSSNVGKNDQLGSTVRIVGNFLALLCLVFATAVTAYVPASLEQRIRSVFFCSLIPAAGFYAGGHILSHLLVVGRKLCTLIAARCFRCFVSVVRSLVMWVGRYVSSVLMLVRRKLSDLTQKIYRSIHHRYWRAHTAFIKYLCLLMRSGAKFAIRM